MTGDEIITAVVLGLAGGSGITGLALYYIRRYLDKRLDAEEAASRLLRERRRRRQAVEDQLHHAYGRCLFWLDHAVTKPPPNGELREAMAELARAEAEKKKLDREILSSYGEEH